MPTSRRRFMALLGGGVVLAATGVGAGFALTRTPRGALAPWAAAGTYAEPRLRALSYAILAPNPHNRQPWLAELVGDDRLRIWRDPARNLPHTDPFDRQMTIGMGAFLELLVIAASDTGHAVHLDLLPDGETGPVADARLVPGAARDPLMTSVLQRRSAKVAYEDRPLSLFHKAELTLLARLVADPAEVAEVRAITRAAWEIEAHTPATWGESVALTRLGRAEIEANPDGISLGGPFLEGLMLAGVLTREASLDTTSQAFRASLQMQHDLLEATPSYAVLTSQGNSRLDQIEAGRRWVRLNLKATELGVSLHPVSQALQEFPEMAEPYARIHALLAGPGETVQMLGRLGYGPATPPKPRWPVETRMLDA